jgi:hypothetical protein
MARTSSTPRPRTPAPWWLGGDEECAHCGQGYAYEVESRCVGCDAPLCPLCVVKEKAAAHCPGCVAKPEARDGARDLEG